LALLCSINVISKKEEALPPLFFSSVF